MKLIVILAILFSSTSICGCKNSSSNKTNEIKYEVISNQTNPGSNSEFNKKTYVWEQLYFPTNRVIDRK